MSRSRKFAPRTQRRRGPAISVVAVPTIALIPAGCDSTDRSAEGINWNSLHSSGMHRVHIESLWQRDLSEWLEFPGGMAMWHDDLIWIGDARSEQVWELDPDSRNLRLARADDGDPGGPGNTIAMAFAPGHGMYVLGRNGIAIYPERTGEPIFHPMNRSEVRGFATFVDGSYLIAYGQYPDDPHVEYALHRYDRNGQHIASWHPAYDDPDWVRVTHFSGGPVAVTRSADLLFSALAPFRIIRYAQGLGDSAVLLVEDEEIISASEFQRAHPSPGTIQFQWSHSTYLDEMTDGRILNVATMYPDQGREPQMHWMVLSDEGDVVARTIFDGLHWVAAPSGPDTRLVYHRGVLENVRLSLLPADTP